MPSPRLKRNERYTYRDYCEWPDGERWELIDGIAYDMSPAPNTPHQSISVRLTALLAVALEGKTCTPFTAPCDVVLSDEDVVQPDLLVVCNPRQITEKNIQGAPDLTIEILSPATAAKDQRIKKALYERYGVKEYLIVDPVWQCVHRCTLQENGQYGPTDYFHNQDELPLAILPGLSLPLWKVFGVEKVQDAFLPEEAQSDTGNA